MFDLDTIRRDTPGCLDKVFLDSAGSSLPPEPVLTTMIEHLRREADVGGYVAAARQSGALAAVPHSLARVIGAQATDIALTDSATRAWNDFFASVSLGPGDRILISGVEYASNAIAALGRARSTGAHVEIIPSDQYGRIDLDALENMLDDRVRLVSVVHVPTNGGLINPVREVVELARAHGSLVLLDACQSFGQLPIDVTELGIDALSATGRKWLRGPRGTGFLYVRPGLVDALEPAAMDLHGAEWTSENSFVPAPDATRFELWETSVAARLGLGVAADCLLSIGTDTVWAQIESRAVALRQGLASIPGVDVHDRGTQLSGIVSFTVEGISEHLVRDQLAAQNITVTVSGRGSTLLDMDARGLDAVVRASPHYFVDEADLDAFLGAVRRLQTSR
ncbi:aminotransferase class V-fold PLP-dependent enzyme [Rhodococcus erythropolis]|uniref:aminotransferase class V-fold PLP-dependent enzyme n=1 Tax=Rhodococcus erythropolis TaxID=1833 RepID=UPI0036701CD7